MLAAIASAALIVAASLTVGQAVLALGGHRDPSALAGPIGLALLLTTTAILTTVDASATAIAITITLLTLISLAAVIVVARGGGGEGRGGPPASAGAEGRRRSALSDTAFAAPAPPAAAAAAAVLASLFAAIPFIAAGNIGVLGVGLVNDDMASHLLLADWIREGFRPEPVLVDQGYPLGPHALVAGVGTLLGAGSIEVFAGLTLALPALTALVAFAALDGLRNGARIASAALVALPYMAAAYLAQEAFKEPIIALFLLAFALLLPTVRGWRDAIPLGVIAAGTVYVYSFPGLAWLVGVAIVWLAIESVRARRPAVPWPALAALAAVAAVLVLPELGRLLDFREFRALDPDRANEGGLGNLPGQISPLEAFGIWPTSEFRLSAAASSIPAVVFYAGALLGAAAFALGLPRWLRRHGTAIPAALATAAILYLAARAFGTVYTSAKALAIAAPLITLITLGGLLAGLPTRKGGGGEGRGGPSASAGAEGRRRSALSDTAFAAPAPALATLAALFGVAAAFSSFLILRQAPVGPEGHAEELAEIRPIVEGEKLLFLGRDNFILHELRGSKPFTHVRNFYDPYFVEPNFELERVGSKFDFDSVTAETLARFPYVLTTRAAYASGPPPGYEAAAVTDSYVLWEQGGEVGDRRPGETDEQPGRAGGCAGSAERVGSFETPPVLGSAGAWTATTIEAGEEAAIELELAPGSWELSLQYDATRRLALAGPGLEATLPANLDYRGTAPFWPAGTIDVGGAGPVTITASVEDPPLAGRLLGADSVAHLGALAATTAGAERVGTRCEGYVDWYVR